LFITGILLCQPQMHAQRLSNKAPFAAEAVTQPTAPAEALPDAPGYPVARPLAASGETATIESDTQTRNGTVYAATGNVVLHYKDYVLRADKLSYDSASGAVTAEGHLQVSGGEDHEEIHATRGELNLHAQTGHFYDVAGSFEARFEPLGGASSPAAGNSNPFLFTAREAVKLGPEHYVIYGGSITSCALPHPDWMFSAGKIEVDDGKAHAANSLFRLHGIPLFYLPYVSHPVNAEERESGIMIPVLGDSSTKGLIIGEEFYLALNRSTDLMVGLQYYSLRGWEQSAAFRYRGPGNNFLTGRYSGLLDRGLELPGQAPINQGGQDVTLSGRHDFDERTRVAADVEYLSSYIYRQAFAEDFFQAVSSDVSSTLYATRTFNGMTAGIMADRYQIFESTVVGNEIRNFHVPELDFAAVPQRLQASPLVWSATASVALLRRVEGTLDPVIANQVDTYRTKDVAGRLDVHPQLDLPLHFDGWTVVPSVGARETWYSQSLQPQLQANGLPTDGVGALNRADVEAGLEVRAPAVERDFSNDWTARVLHRDVRHAIEPMLNYRWVAGVDNFKQVPRFDSADIVSDTNELEYGLTQRLFLRKLASYCRKDESCGGTNEWLRWRIGQKLYFQPGFGGAVTAGARNIFATTLDFSGVAFVTAPRHDSPIVSRMRVRTTEHTDLQWDLDYDSVAGRIAASNTLLDVRGGEWFGGVGHARLDAPGEISGQPVSNFNQFRFLVGYGHPNQLGLNAAANVGIDLLADQIQYGAFQGAYNWNCCGLSVEYRKFELGSVRNENEYRFNFTLKGVGTAGNLRRAEQVF
jgi:LPS-assembly protein